MIEIIIGNIASIGAMICDSYSGTRRTRRDMLIAQIFSQFFYIASSLVLKAYSATTQNVVTVFRNLVAIKKDPSKKVAIFFTALPVVLGLIFNNRGLMGLLPIVANLEYSIIMFACPKNVNAIKLALIINCSLFAVFNFYVLNFVSAIASIIISVTTAISLYKSKKEKSIEAKNE